MKKKNQRKMKSTAMVFDLPVILEKDADGYFVYCPRLQGCYSQGDTYEEAITNITDAIKLHLEERLANDEPIPDVQSLSLTSVKVAV